MVPKFTLNGFAPPQTATVGQAFFNIQTAQIMVYDGTQWIPTSPGALNLDRTPKFGIIDEDGEYKIDASEYNPAKFLEFIVYCKKKIPSEEWDTDLTTIIFYKESYRTLFLLQWG